MAAIKTEGIILKINDLRETSQIITLFTKDFGKISGVLKGVRDMRSASGSLPQIFSVNELIMHMRPKSDLHLISEYDLIDYFLPIRQCLDKISQASFFIDLVNALTEVNDPNLELYMELENILRMLSASEGDTVLIKCTFEIRLLHLIGILPLFEKCLECEEKYDSKGLFYYLKSESFSCYHCRKEESSFQLLAGTIKYIDKMRKEIAADMNRLRMSSAIKKNLEKFLSLFIECQIKRKLKSRNFIDKMKRFA